jgi:tetratricopeptide (TPR) repeat protein
LEHRVRAAIRLAQGRPREALAELQTAASHAAVRVGTFDLRYVPITDHPELARAYDRLGRPDSALAVYERYLAAIDLYRVNMDALELGDALTRAAGLHAARGDRRRAALLYRRLAELWRDADPRLRAAALAAERAAATG